MQGLIGPDEEKSSWDEFNKSCTLSYRSVRIRAGSECAAPRRRWSKQLFLPLTRFAHLFVVLDSTAYVHAQRVIGFVVFFAIGVILSIIAAFYVFDLADAPAKFAVPYTIGMICSICASMFLSGPVKQVKSMFDERRRITTILLLLSIVGTLIAAFASHMVAPTIICIIVQMLLFCWYTLSYVPADAARRSVINCCKSAVSV
jgi:hypothetical protein